MDLAPQRLSGTPVAFSRDHINDLLAQLEHVDEAVGQRLAKSRMGGGVVGMDVPREHLTAAARALRDTLGCEMLTTVTGVDMVDHIESIYHFRSLAHNWVIQVRVKLPNEAPEVESLVSLYPSADWLEREQYDLLGIIYQGHPDLRRILLDDEFEGYPLRRNFRQTPLTVHDRATTQVDAVRATSGEQTRHQERIVLKRLGQGDQERIHPGMMTFGSEAVFLETGQGIGTDDNAMHGYTVNTDEAKPVLKPQQDKQE